ncbi:Crp/Fnr family transcriptional regulator [Cyanothece sp. BG0011]|uniref:Crp/Fnr family transcriptional regulator n=1 Tax=Cyanothece sp. BG0011 TaxID=2082950 RepID=UPI000D1E8098|nr:Crp/Fnr family transcriptional regulator [Cyanothece sp. BG0011]
MNISYSPLNNRLLAALPEREYQRISPHLEFVNLRLGQILYEANTLIKWVYFPHRSIISIVSRLKGNVTTEIGLVGYEGMVGIPVILGGQYATNETVVQVADGAFKINADILRQEFQRGETLHKILLLYTETRLHQVSQVAVCKSHHCIEKRFCRWLLLVHDGVENDRLLLTQKFMAQMLGVRRASVTEAAKKIQELGLISYKRGEIMILNRAGLEERVCDCYHLIRQEFDRLMALSSFDE